MRYITVNNTPRQTPSHSLNTHTHNAPVIFFVGQLIDVFHWFKYMTWKKNTWHADNALELVIQSEQASELVKAARGRVRAKGKLGYTEWIVYEGRKKRQMYWYGTMYIKETKYQYLWRFFPSTIHMLTHEASLLSNIDSALSLFFSFLRSSFTMCNVVSLFIVSPLFPSDC